MTDSRTVQDSKQPLVYVCVLNWNRHEETLGCIRHLAAQQYSNARIVVVDNGSTPDSVAALQSSGLPFDLILNPGNMGYTGGCNIGIRHALKHGADYVWLVNSDVVVEADTLTRLIRDAQDNPTAGLLGPVIYYNSQPRQIQNCGTQVDVKNFVYDHPKDINAAIQSMRTAPRQFCLGGTALLVRRAVIERIGLLDERFFAYVEDVDYCVRANGAGFEGRLVPEAGILHGAPEVGRPTPVPSPLRDFYMTRNQILFWAKHATGLNRLRYVYWRIGSSLRYAGSGRVDPATAEAVLDGIWCGLIRRTGAWSRDDRRLKAPALVRRILRFGSRRLVNRRA